MLQRQPIATSAALAKATGLTAATVNKALAHLERIGIVSDITNRQRGPVFSYARYVEELAAGIEPGAWGGSLVERRNLPCPPFLR